MARVISTYNIENSSVTTKIEENGLYGVGVRDGYRLVNGEEVPMDEDTTFQLGSVNTFSDCNDPSSQYETSTEPDVPIDDPNVPDYPDTPDSSYSVVINPKNPTTNDKISFEVLFDDNTHSLIHKLSIQWNGEDVIEPMYPSAGTSPEKVSNISLPVGTYVYIIECDATDEPIEGILEVSQYTAEHLSREEKLRRRKSDLGNSRSYLYTVVPKIQTTYGFADMGACVNTAADADETIDDGSFITTHKIGYEDRDRFSIGEETCNSYLFMSPVNHNEIQVDGDSVSSGRSINAGNSLRVPIIFQYRMTDYNGSIFGNPANKATDLSVKNAKFANIIGLDIWTDRNALRPNQYDIVVYSTFGNVIETNTSRVKTSTQTLVDAGTEIANNINRMVNDNRSVATKTPLLGRLRKVTSRLFK